MIIDPARHLILRVAAKLLIPIIVVFALYVQTHGEYGPGGGFQAGVILASAVILQALVFGPEAGRRFVPPVAAAALAAAGVALYAWTGLGGLLFGEAYLDHDGIAALLGVQPTVGQHIGILLVEWGVFFTVSGSLVAIFHAFLGRAEESDESGD